MSIWRTTEEQTVELECGVSAVVRPLGFDALEAARMSAGQVPWAGTRIMSGCRELAQKHAAAERKRLIAALADDQEQPSDDALAAVDAAEAEAFAEAFSVEQDALSDDERTLMGAAGEWAYAVMCAVVAAGLVSIDGREGASALENVKASVVKDVKHDIEQQIRRVSELSPEGKEPSV